MVMMKGLEAMNRGKVGHPYRLMDRYVEFLAVPRYLFSMPYRRLEGFTRRLHRLVPKIPSATIRLDPSPYEPLHRADGPLVIAVDSTGIRVHRLVDGLRGAMGGRNATSRSTSL